MKHKLLKHIQIFLIILTIVRGHDPSDLEWSIAVEGKLVNQIAQNDLASGIYSEVVRNLRDNGIPAKFVSQAFSDPDIRIVDEVVERWKKPAERLSYSKYRKIFVTKERILQGKSFYGKYKTLIDLVASRYQVDPFILVSLVGVESHYGTNSKEYLVFNALNTIIHRIPRKEKWVIKEMTEFLKYCYNDYTAPMSIYGSYAGAFGNGQFIPSSYNHYALDFDGDGMRNPFEWPDVFASIANYLVKNGYEKGSSDFSRKSKNWKSIYAYNPSVNYVKVILELRNEIEKSIK